LSGSDARKPALELLARILTDGDASRLHRVLVEEQKLAISADSYIEAGFDPGTVWFMLSLPTGGDLVRTEAVFGAEIDKVIQSGITAAELERARNQALADFWRGLTTIDGKAQALGTYAVLQGGHERLFTAPKAYESVTADDIRKVASELLRPTNRTVGVLSTSSAAAGEEG
jgi:zinc protease